MGWGRVGADVLAETRIRGLLVVGRLGWSSKINLSGDPKAGKLEKAEQKETR